MNREAVGFDVANEANRLEAATKARETAAAQITGPIVLVQDEHKTPGFLFYAPSFDEEGRFRGLVYAPFVVQRLMNGVLANERRHVSLRVMDAHSTLYDELVSNVEDYDPDPLLATTRRIPMAGREWTFELRSDLAFATSSRAGSRRTRRCRE